MKTEFYLALGIVALGIGGLTLLDIANSLQDTRLSIDRQTSALIAAIQTLERTKTSSRGKEKEDAIRANL